MFVGSYVAQESGRKDHPGYNKLDVVGQKEKYKYGPNDVGVKQIETNLFGTGGVDRVIYNENFSNAKVFPKWYKNFEGNFYIRGKSTFKQFSTYGNVILGGVRSNNIIEFKDGAYIDGNLEIRNDVEVKGPIFVNGNLTITGKDITINSVIYVKGMAHIKHAEYDETVSDEVKGDHIIYADRKIVLERINRFNDYPAKLNAYYYSNESIEMDGNESHVTLKGGISAPRIVLNSIRGRSYAGANLFKQSNPQVVEGRAFEGSQEQERREPRLKIVYDDAIFKKYSHLILDSRITAVLPSKTISMEEVT